MKRLVALLLILGLLAITASSRAGREDTKEKEKVEKKDEKKVDTKTTEKKKEPEKKEPEKKEPEKKEPEKKEPSPEEVKELAKLSGVFDVTLFERDGKKYSDEQIKKMKVDQLGPKWSFHDGETGTVTEGTDRVFLDKSPKAIDSTYTNGPAKGKTVLGIYELSGDTIKYCWAEPGKDRPKEFGSKAGSDLTLMILKKAKVEKKEPEKKEPEKKK
jgi:uncharacterized protein (TIGR03067 family)